MNKCRKRRGKRGGVVVKLKILLWASSKLSTRLDRLTRECDSNRSYVWRSSLDAYAWNIPILPNMGYQRHLHLSPCLSGVSVHFLRPLRRAWRQMEDPVQIKMALINARSVVNKTFILRDFFTARSLDFLFITETCLSNGDLTPFSELLPPKCKYFKSPRSVKSGGSLATIF